MTGTLLWRGMLAGILAALLATVFARAFAEPHVDRAIAFEEAHEAHGSHGMADDEADAPVSRATQKGLGLATAVALYGAAVGGLFALVFAYGYGRIGRIGPRTLAVLVAAIGFLIIVVAAPAVLRGAIACALSAPADCVMHVDVAPLSTLVLSFNGRWRMQELARYEAPTRRITRFR